MSKLSKKASVIVFLCCFTTLVVGAGTVLSIEVIAQWSSLSHFWRSILSMGIYWASVDFIILLSIFGYKASKEAGTLSQEVANIFLGPQQLQDLIPKNRFDSYLIK